MQPGKKCKNFSQRKLKEGETKVETKNDKKWVGKMKTEKEKVKWNEIGWIAR